MKKLFIILSLLVAFSASAFRVDSLLVPTRHLDSSLEVTVIVPEKATPYKPVPTVYMLNGYSGGHKDWIKRDKEIGDLADRFGVILVMPNGRDSWYWDSPINPGMQMESAIVKDLVPYIDGHYPTVADRSKRAISGLSMGGHGAFWISSRHPDLFGSVGAMSGGVDIVPFPKSWKMADQLGPYEENPERWRWHSVMNQIPALKEANLNIIFDCGNDDFFKGVNDELHRRLLEEKIPHDYISRPGNHSWKYWCNSIIYHLTFFNEVFTKQ